LKTLSKKVRKGSPQFKLAIDQENQNLNNKENKKEINKEIIRRLRIQNKKLIEQVIRFKEEIKKAENNRIQVRNSINELLELIEK
jgi:hypothetical protein